MTRDSTPTTFFPSAGPSDAVGDALAVGDAVARVGFDWPDAQGALLKVEEEVQEIRAWLGRADAHARDQLEAELGDLMFSVCMVARKLQLDPMTALERTNAKFKARFDAVALALKAQGVELEQASLEQMERAWEQAKRPDTEV